MDGLVPGRIVYFVFDAARAAQVMRRRTDSGSILERLQTDPPQWPAGAQAHIGNAVQAGDILPAMVLRVWGPSGCSNLRVVLDGADDFWATSINFDEGKAPGTWHWMFAGQQGRYTPDRGTSPVTPAEETAF